MLWRWNLNGVKTVKQCSDAAVRFGPVLGRKSSNLELDFRSGSGKFPDLKPGSSPVRQFWTEPLPYLGTVQVILHRRTWFQVRFKQFLNFEPDFGQVRQGSGWNFGSGPNCSITRWARLTVLFKCTVNPNISVWCRTITTRPRASQLRQPNSTRYLDHKLNSFILMRLTNVCSIYLRPPHQEHQKKNLNWLIWT